MYTPELGRSFADQAGGQWIRYDLQRHANGTIGGYVHVCDGYAGPAVNGVVEYQSHGEMLETAGCSRTEAGCRITVVLDGESVVADPAEQTDNVPGRPPSLSSGSD